MGNLTKSVFEKEHYSITAQLALECLAEQNPFSFNAYDVS
jgi:hypothetical protein